MKELEWIKELEEDFKSGDQTRFPPIVQRAEWENYAINAEHRAILKQINKKFSQSAKDGDYTAMRRMGEYYCVGRATLHLHVDFKKAIYWYSRAAEHKSLYRGDVLYMLAYCYEHARGANRDRKKAFKMFEALAKIDCSKLELPELAQFTDRAKISLAGCYLQGIGTEKNEEKALSVWREYADKKDDEVFYNLGVAYLEGKPIKDYKRAHDIFLAAWMWFDDVRAIDKLGWCSENGYGIEKDIENAIGYYQIAADRRYRPAISNFKRLILDYYDD